MPGVTLRTAKPGTPGLGDPRSRSAEAVAKPWSRGAGEGLQVGKGVISICFFWFFFLRGVFGAREG